MRRDRGRKWDTTDDDPTAGLVNLFDIWMVFAVALLLAFVEAGFLKPGAGSAARQTAAPSLEPVQPEAVTVTQIRLTHEQLTGQGQRLGTAYRLTSGQVVYVPDATPDRP